MVYRLLQQIIPFKYQIATYTLAVVLGFSLWANIQLYENSAEWENIAGEAIWYGNSALDWGNSIYGVCARNLQGGA